MSPAAESVIQRLDAARQKWWLFTLLTTAVLAVSVSFGMMLLFMLADSFLTFSQPVLAVLFLGWLSLTIGLVAMIYRRLVRGQRSLEATARRVETEFPELGSDLINLVQLSEGPKDQDPAFCAAAVGQAAQQVGRIPFEQAARKETRLSRFLYRMQTPRDLSESFVMLAGLVILAVICQWLIPTWGSAASRLLAPWEFVPSVGSVEILEVTPGDTEILVGSGLEIAAKIRNPGAKPHEARLLITRQDEQETELPMSANKKWTGYKATLPTVAQPFTYRLEIGDSQTRIYTVGVRRKPTVGSVKVTYHYPTYLARPEETLTAKHADLQAPQYTTAELHIRPTTPIAKGRITWGAKSRTGRVDEGGKLLVVRIPMIADGAFTIHMFNDAGHSDPDPRPNRITVVPDQPPSVQLLKPGRQSTASPGASVPVMIRGGDDHGLGRVRLEMKILSGEGGENDVPVGKTPTKDRQPVRKVKEWTDLAGNTAVVLNDQMRLDPDLVQPGQTVRVRAVVWDRRDVSDWDLDLRPQQTASPWHVIRLVDRQQEVAQAQKQWEGIRTAIMKILETQVRARVKTANLPRREQPAQATALAAEVRAHQVDVQKSTLALAERLDKAEQEEQRAIRRVLGALAVGHMLDAVKQCDGLVKITALEAFTQPAGRLGETQDQIITSLRKLLDSARRAETRGLSEMKKRPGGDLPEDTKQKLEELNAKLDQFLREQKRVIEATENLAKKPVEDFTEEEEQLLQKLAEAQDDWARFMKELHSDLSKVPEQDFANSSMLQEAIEIQTELKMAKDALTKKCADIAVPLEQLGAEMAEEIKTNMEKWLPDKPDRERWSQEEYVSDKDKEAPMPELMGELEDLIGELAELEEDLFDEMEDISSSAADSADKGVGWDALDGPISDMGAKGVTGNQLPNTSEMAGRSGEGRSGKSSGEFVGDEAVGKGGHKTPSRLTPDPYEKGVVKDHSKDPVGGATGGGKESGQGGEGLEGPGRRNPGQRELQRLAGKQAALRNKAEGVELQFQILNFHHTDLERLIDLMAQVERDLKAGRYQNALRQRKVVAKGLAGVKQYIEGEFQVRQDATTNLPADIQKEILGSMQDRSPVGWEEVNRRYFRRLSTAETDPSEPADPTPTVQE